MDPYRQFIKWCWWRDEHNRHLDKRLTAEPEAQTHFPPEWCSNDPQKDEWERRVQWWLTFYEWAVADPSTDVIADFREAYGRAVQQVINIMELRIGNIHQRQKIYKAIGL